MNESSLSPDNLVEEPIPQNEIIRNAIDSIQPETEEELISKLKDLVTHMEFNIDQNRKRCDVSSKECYVLFKSTELLAFDLLFADYLLGNSESSDIYDFFEHCTHPTCDFLSNNGETANAHISYLMSIIEKCVESLSSCEIKQPNIPKRISEFELFLNDQKLRIDNQLTRRLKKQKEKEEKEKMKEKEEEEEEPDLSGLPPSFTKWLSSELKVGLNPDEESVEIKCLVRGIAGRLKEIAQLSESIKNLKKENEEIRKESMNITNFVNQVNSQSENSNQQNSLQNSSNENIDNDININHYNNLIENSPYFLGIKNSCAYLANLLKTIKTQKEVIKLCNTSLKQCKTQLDSLSDSSQRSIQEMQNQMEKLKEISLKRQQETTALEQELQPYINFIFTPTRLNAIPGLPNSFNVLDIRYKRLIIPATNTDQKLRMEYTAFHELHQLRSDLSYYSNELNKMYSQIEENDRKILEMAIEYSKIEGEFKLQDEEKESLMKYEIDLNEVQTLLRFNEMSDWCRKLATIIEALDQIAVDQQNIVQELQNTSQVDQLKQQIDQKTKEVQLLSETNYRMNSEIGRSKLELSAANEEYFRAKQELEVNKDFIPDVIDKNDEEQVQRHKRMVICPICHTNRRDVILTTCRHPMCGECANKANFKCPICEESFNQSNVRPFFIQ
ncbi:hypothetical protein TRFO_04266 [Tritrichomonas foetus]|uniref:E3 ubiquitin protein ligase n=1 Tax=Tritrichomonas foetus TaxID=1144522 RepID=A0A1J4KGS7_9EUKA|nr:hypothetical protein TRFO_04266 [Tritrichomonas foetus]|eukprot:OHT10258.1 hypothetical protein TRFO_04266 [Tritrichomonas foetus]